MIETATETTIVPIDEFVNFLVQEGYAEVQRDGTSSRDTWEAELCERRHDDNMCWPHSLINYDYEWTRTVQ